jgi:hypothetical protein
MKRIKSKYSLGLLILSLLICIGVVYFTARYRLPNTRTIISYGSLSDGDKSFAGSILGSIIGTIGALGVALLAVWLDRVKNKKRENIEELRTYNRYLITSEVALNAYIPSVLKNIKHLDSIISLERPGNFLMTLPRIMEISYENVMQMRNPQLINNWTTLCIRTGLINQLTEDFVESYVKLRDIVQLGIIKKEQMDEKIIVQEFNKLNGFATSVKNAIEQHVEYAIEVLALVQLHGEKGSDKKGKFKHPKELTSFIFTDKKVSEKTAALSKEFSSNMFKDV